MDRFLSGLIKGGGVVFMMVSLSAWASSDLKIYTNGYEVISKNVNLDGVKYDSAKFSKFKITKDTSTYSSYTKMVRNDDNWYATAYDSVGGEQGTELGKVLSDILRGSYKDYDSLQIISNEHISKEKLLSLFSKTSPVYRYLSYCMVGGLESHYLVKRGILSADVSLGSDVKYSFDIDLKKRSVVSVTKADSHCDKSLSDFSDTYSNKLPPSLLKLLTTAKK
ncbi:hypothetical protein [Photobacterium kishitanii]|uniref:Uncharacterized protein n=1 Tax=Photobacterium kishitanii TaxID=318456 RepID=A0A2T3KMR6_9GAMM|nr:hypothetical protein [Photobacterium kishitanii]PSV01093.1 hypothetical protein C9J27_03480 [Photobacterium kishitanii]